MLLRVIALLLFLSLSVPAAAQRTVTVIGVDGGPLGTDVALRISSGMLGGAEDADETDVMDYTNVTVDDVMQLVGCSAVELPCLTELAATLETDVLLYGEFGPESESGAPLELTFFEAGSVEIPAPFSLRIPEEGVQEFVSARAQAFLDGNAHVTISGDADGQILVDGRLEGAAPLTLTTLAPGAYEFGLQLADGRVNSIQVEIPDVGEHSFEIRAPRGRSPVLSVDGPERSVRPARVAGWIGVALGVGSFGIAAYHGNEVANAQRRFDATPYQAEAYAIANEGRKRARTSNTFVAVGVGFTAAGVLALVLDRPRQDEQAAAAAWTVAPAQGGAIGVVRWTR